VPQPRRGTIALHRGDRMVRQMLHEHAAALSAAARANRSRRLSKCAKDCGYYHFDTKSNIGYVKVDARCLSLGER
jgi:hypothetical protein